jgi:hypothetical protein
VTIRADSTLREVAFLVCTALHEAGITAVLTGGTAASLYAPEAIQSFDLDFVITAHAVDGEPEAVLKRLGYRRVGQDYKHADSRYPLEFPKGPLAIGDERIMSWETLRKDGLLLHVLTPTDSCRDRLAAFYFFDDRNSLEQARAIFAAQAERVDLDAIRRWSEKEGQKRRYQDFLRRIEQSG